MYILADIIMPYLLCTGLRNPYLAGNGNMNHCLHFRDGGMGGGVGTNCNCKIVSVCVCKSSSYI